MQQVLRANTEAEAGLLILKNLPRPLPKLIRVEGFMGTGKTKFAKALAKETNSKVVNFDRFIVSRDRDDLPYEDYINQDRVKRRLEQFNRKETVTFIEGICLGNIATEAEWGRGYVIYLKRFSVNSSSNPTWHPMYHIEDAENGDIPSDADTMEASILRYHIAHKPHEKANMIIELPDVGYSWAGPLPEDDHP